jgi:hypothetical protein
MTVLLLIVVGLYAVGWLVSVFLVAVEAMPTARKIGWFAALTLLAPVSIPYYLVTRFLRFRREGAGAESAVGS